MRIYTTFLRLVPLRLLFNAYMRGHRAGIIDEIFRRGRNGRYLTELQCALLPSEIRYAYLRACLPALYPDDIGKCNEYYEQNANRIQIRAGRIPTGQTDDKYILMQEAYATGDLSLIRAMENELNLHEYQLVLPHRLFDKDRRQIQRVLLYFGQHIDMKRARLQIAIMCDESCDIMTEIHRAVSVQCDLSSAQPDQVNALLDEISLFAASCAAHVGNINALFELEQSCGLSAQTAILHESDLSYSAQDKLLRANSFAIDRDWCEKRIQILAKNGNADGLRAFTKYFQLSDVEKTMRLASVGGLRCVLAVM